MKRLPLVRSLAAAYARVDRVTRTLPVLDPVRTGPIEVHGFGEVARPREPWRRWAAAALLVVLPMLVYWPAIMGHYGLRDDYSVLREAHEEPGKVIRVCAMQARPLYGLLMAGSFHHTGGIADFWRLRLACALLIGGVAATLFLLLRRWNWDRWTAFGACGLLTVLPCAQIAVGWAVAWPLPVAILLALAAFGAAERSFAWQAGNPVRSRTQRRRIQFGLQGAIGGRVTAARRRIAAGWWVLAVVLVAASAWVYQSNSLFYFTAVTAALWSRRRWQARHGLEWLTRHVATVGIGLLVAFTGMAIAFANNWVPVSNRVAIESDWLGKLAWFVRQPLKNALGLIALNDDAGSPAVHRLAALVALAIVAGLARAGWRRRTGRAAWWVYAIPGLVLGSFAVNMLVADRWPVYRVLMPLSATVVVVLAIGLLSLGGRKLARFGLLALLVPGVWLARRQTVDLIATPQSIELGAMSAEAAKIDPARRPRVFVITPTPDEHIADRVFSDEFGSLSTDSDWVPKEMLKLLMWERYPEVPNVNTEYTVTCGHRLPNTGNVDVVIDLRRMRDFGSR